MVHTTRMNYKAKWQAAVNAGTGSEKEEVLGLVKNASNIVGAEVQANLGLRKLGGTLMEAASAAKSLITLMDDAANVGKMQFASTSQNIDLRLNDGDFNLIARRLRDVLRMAEARVGILTEAYDDAHTALSEIKKAHISVSSQSELLQNTVANTLMIGNHATPEELTEFARANRTETEYSRFGSPYEDLDDDWTDNIFATTAKKIENTSLPSPPESTDEHAIVPSTNRDRRAKRASNIGAPKNIEFD
jgi:hypothetical protein